MFASAPGGARFPLTRRTCTMPSNARRGSLGLARRRISMSCLRTGSGSPVAGVDGAGSRGLRWRLRRSRPARIIALRNGGPCRFPASNSCEPRQARKGATVAATSRAGGSLAGVATHSGPDSASRFDCAPGRPHGAVTNRTPSAYNDRRSRRRHFHRRKFP